MRRFTSYLRSLTEFSRPTRLFLLAMFVTGLSNSIAWLVLNFHLKALRLTEVEIGRINSVPSLTLVVCGLLLGRWSDRAGRKRSLVAGSVLGAVALAGLGLASGVWGLAMAAGLGGIGSLLVQGNAPPFMAENSSEGERTRLFAVQAALVTGTGFLGNQVGGALPDLFARVVGGAADSVEALRTSLLVAAGLAAAGILPLLRLPAPARNVVVVETGQGGGRLPQSGPAGENRAPAEPGADRRDPDAAEVPSLPAAAAPAAADPSAATGAGSAAPPASDSSSAPPLRLAPGLTARLLLPTAFIGIGAGMTMPFMNLYIHGKFDVPVGVVGMIFGWSALVTAAFMLAQPWIASRFGKVRAVVLSQLGSIPFLLALAYVPWFPLAAIGLFLRGALMNMAVPVYAAFCMGKIPPGARAMFVTMQMVCWNAGWALGSNLSGWVREAAGFRRGFDLLFAAMMLLYIASSVGFYVWFREDRD